MKNQRGVGMVEVLVSLLILAIAVMGFVALQVRAIQASQDALTKTQAMHFMQSISESIRINRLAKSQYMTSLNRYALADTKPTSSKDCAKTACSTAEFAGFEAIDIASQANAFGIQMGLATCPGISTATEDNLKRLCIFSVWEGTKLSGSTDDLDFSRCMDDAGHYVKSSNCLMMETY